ncbi:MAG TPA: hypothetical protein VHO02_05000 [Fibrobacteria bacterium]|nr:hypothetical protein [Fibrobacteria bacterium]
MTLRIPRFLVPAVLAAAVIFPLSGCWFSSGSGKVAGGDDYPNSIETLGRTAAAERADTTDWNGWNDAPGTPPGVYDSEQVPDSVPRSNDSVLVRRADLGDIHLDPAKYIPGFDLPGANRIVDTLLPEGGLRRTVRVQSADLFIIRDTTWSSLGLGGKPEVRRVSGRLDLIAGGYLAFTFDDDEGDSSITPRAGVGSKVRMRFTTGNASGRVEEKILRFYAAPGLPFTKGKDALLNARTTIRQGNDTLLTRALLPAGGDSVSYDPARDSNRVEVEQATHLAGGALEESYYVSVVFADSGRNYPVRYRRVLSAFAGVTETTLLGRDSLPDFAPGDTGRMRAVFASSIATDTLEGFEATYRVKLSDTAGHSRGNTLLRVERGRTFRLGRTASTRYVLVPSAPVPDGMRPRAGALDMRVDLRTSGWVKFSGTASASGFTGSWTSSQGRSGTASFDSLGARVSSP